MSETERLKRSREDEEEGKDSCDVNNKRLRGLTAEGEELMHLLEDVDSCGERNEDLVNGVMRSLEEEIGVSLNTELSAAASCSDGSEVESENSSPDSRIDLGYLLEASDDELGIPPTVESGSSEECCCVDILENPVVPTRGDYEGLGLWQFEDYGPLEFEYDVNRFNELEAERAEFGNAGYMFEYCDVDQSWRRESAAACGI